MAESYEPPVWMQVPLLTVVEVAQWAKVSPKTVYRWIEAGRLEAIRFGDRTYRIPAPSLERYLREQGYDLFLEQWKE
jgi:excisionase family DNA binding protein